MRYLIPDTDQPNPDLFRVIIEDWIEAHPEDLFRATHPNITYLLHSHWPSHLADDHDQVWAGFWEGYLPGDDQVLDVPKPDTGLELSTGQVLSQDDLDLIYQALLSRLSKDFSGLEGITPTRHSSDA